nr:M56 family metallopeptidase [Paenibacillus riograndensis]
MLIKLLVPVAPQSPVSLFNLFPHAVPAPAIVQPSLADQIYEEKEAGQHWITIGALVWFGGLLFLGGYYLWSVLVFRKRVGNSRKPVTQEVLPILEACTKKLNLHQTVPIYETSSLRSPCLHGLLRPAIYLPEDIAVIADSNQLTHILMHELTHYKRKDLWFNFLWTLSIGLHWYNPFVWLAVRRMKADQEVACDAGVLEVLGARESSSYGMTLLMLSRLFSQKPVPGVNLTHFWEHKNETKRRVMMITRFKRGSYIGCRAPQHCQYPFLHFNGNLTPPLSGLL